MPRRRVNAGDGSTDRRGRVRDAPAILRDGFRPFFLLASCYAALLIPAWLWIYTHGGGPAGAFRGVAWHAHEALFGYLGAVIAGFVLTAVPNWTGRLPISGVRLAILVGLWLVGRLAVALHDEPVSVAILDLAFPATLSAVVWREILVGRNLGNVPVAILLTLFAAADLLDDAAAFVPVLDGYGTRLALAVAALLIALVGGRIIPSFTRNWMARAQLAPLPAPRDSFDLGALALTAVGLAGWVGFPAFPPGGAMLVAAGLALLGRLSRWRGHRTLREPIVLVLHLGYLWLSIALILLGLSAMLPALIPASSAIHALTAGAVGTMTLAVMTRATRGHTGRALSADRATVAIYALVTFAAVLRVAAPFAGEAVMPVLIAGGTLWSAAFGLFALVYGPMLLTRRRA